MKQFKLILIIAITFFVTPCFGAQTTGVIIQTTTTGNMTQRDMLNYAFDQQSYTTGGITFTYPANWFSTPPFIQISVIQSSAHPTSETYVAEVSANSASSTTVMVYQVSSGVVTEAPASSMLINLLAVANPA